MTKKLLALSSALILIVAVAVVGDWQPIRGSDITTHVYTGTTARQLSGEGIPGGRAVVWDNGMLYDGLGASQYDALYDPPLDPILADDFEFAATQQVNDVHWIGGYYNGPPDDGDFDWEIKFYDNDPSGPEPKPGTEIATYYFANANVNETFIEQIGTTFYFSYSVNLGSVEAFMGGAKYWISIQGIGNYQPQSGWAYHEDPIILHEAMFKSDYFGYPDWTNSSTVFGYAVDMCFQLTYEEMEECIWNDGDDHKMHFAQLPDEDGWDVNATYPIVVADDWQCTETGYVGDIHFWGSWKHDDIGEIDHWLMAIHSNIPADQSPTGYSMPANDFLWAWDIIIEWANIVPIQLPTPMEGWYDPSTGEEFYNDHEWYFQYNVCLYDFVDESQMFYQYQDSIYWLEIIAVVVDPVNTQWGWKNSEDHFMDDAVWADIYVGRDWQELYEPGSGLEPIINSFWIELDGNGNAVAANTGGTDYYDDGTGASVNGWYFYPNTGWWNIWFYDHPFDPERYKEIFIFFDWAPTGGEYWIEVALNWATPDWPPGEPPPIPPLTPTEEEMYIHREYLPITGPGWQEFWITVPDYNPEWVSVDIMGMNVVIFNDPMPVIEHQCLPQEGVSMDMAFVITGMPAEEEPYDTVVCEPQTGEFDTHPPHYWYHVTPTIFGRCDFHVKVYDSILSHYSNWYEPVNWTHQLHKVAGDWWVSWCNPGCTDAIFALDSFGFDNPHPSVWGDWRTTADPPGSCDPYAGVVDSSENHTSDPDGYGYRVHVPSYEYEYDFGDVPDGPYPTLLANAGARHVIVPGIHLGHLIDPEADGQPSVDALGDDKNPLALGDDEDGVVFTTLVVQGQAATVKVTASIGGAYLNAWADWNADGDWDDPVEQIFTNQVLNAGANYLTVIVPSDAHIGTTYSRFRFSTIFGLDYTGLTDDGEVEDYRLFILKPLEDVKMHWPQWPDLDSTGMDVDMFYGKLADDFRCEESGPITDIHFWGSFADDILPPGGPGPGSLTFLIQIYSNIPADQNPDGYWSKPDSLLCEWIFGPGTYSVHQVCDNNPEDWYDPFSWLWINDNHFNAYQYDFFIEDDVCYQEKGTIYWLAIKDLWDIPPEYSFGWKTTEFELRFMDDAAALVEPPTYWWPLTYPSYYEPYEYADSTLDLAFVITGGTDWACGDVNDDGIVDIDDVVYLIAYIFSGGPPPVPYEAGDVNCDGIVDIDDVVYLIAYIFSGGPPPCDIDGDGVLDCGQ